LNIFDGNFAVVSGWFPLKPIVCEAQSAVESGVPNLNRRAIAGRRKRLNGWYVPLIAVIIDLHNVVCLIFYIYAGTFANFGFYGFYCPKISPHAGKNISSTDNVLNATCIYTQKPWLMNSANFPKSDIICWVCLKIVYPNIRWSTIICWHIVLVDPISGQTLGARCSINNPGVNMHGWPWWVLETRRKLVNKAQLRWQEKGETVDVRFLSHWLGAVGTEDGTLTRTIICRTNDPLVK